MGNSEVLKSGTLSLHCNGCDNAVSLNNQISKQCIIGKETDKSLTIFLFFNFTVLIIITIFAEIKKREY